MGLSPAAAALWAKMERGGDKWLPLHVHMSDAAEIARLLWREWLPDGLRALLGETLGLGRALAERLVIFLAAAHDLGKATPAFQFQPPRLGQATLAEIQSRLLDRGLKPPKRWERFSHALASQAIVERFTAPGAAAPHELGLILGGHHGRPASAEEWGRYISQPGPHARLTGFQDKAWLRLQEELYHHALALAGWNFFPWPRPKVAAQVILSALVIMADWISSGSELLPLFEPDSASARRPSEDVPVAWARLGLPPRVEVLSEEQYTRFDLYHDRFGLSGSRRPRPAQVKALEIALAVETPGLLIIEAPMGEGKTEAALVAAEIFAAKTGRGGLYFALPTQATSDGLFGRLAAWAGKAGCYGGRRSLKLAHGKSRFNEEYRGYHLAKPNVGENGDKEENLIVHSWFEGRKKSLLADFVIGTVDHVLMGALRQNHLALRHLGLAGKVVVIDECHAYDAYMNSHLHRVLGWLGLYGAPVILLSATLPAGARRELVNAYLRQEEPCHDPLAGPSEAIAALPAWATAGEYPLLTYTDGRDVKTVCPESSGRTLKIEVTRLPPGDADEILVDRLADLLSGGGCAGLVFNTVSKAQRLAARLAETFGGDVRLFHSRFLAPDRAAKENELREMLKPGGRRPKRLIVVGTQVLEQSLDVDFDLLVTDICPLDLLLQRLGRLHRFPRVDRPAKLAAAQVLVGGLEKDGFELGTKKVYGLYHLLNAVRLLPDSLTLPDDVPRLVQAAYDFDRPPDSPQRAEEREGALEEYREAKRRYDEKREKKRREATNFQIAKPADCLSLKGWLSTGVDDPAGRRASATARDGAEGLEVILLQRRGGGFCTLSGREKISGQAIPQ